MSPLKILFKVMATPVEGWKALRRAKLPLEDVGNRCFYPITGVAALSQFSILFFDVAAGVQQAVVAALVTFISFFFSYFLMAPLGRLLMPRGSKDFLESTFGKELTMLLLSTLALFYTLYTLVPPLQPVLVFLPIWTVYLVTRASRFIKADQSKRNTVAGMFAVLIVGTPLLVNWVFSWILE